MRSFRDFNAQSQNHEQQRRALSLLALFSITQTNGIYTLPLRLSPLVFYFKIQSWEILLLLVSVEAPSVEEKNRNIAGERRETNRTLSLTILNLSLSPQLRLFFFVRIMECQSYGSWNQALVFLLLSSTAILLFLASGRGGGSDAISTPSDLTSSSSLRSPARNPRPLLDQFPRALHQEPDRLVLQVSSSTSSNITTDTFFRLYVMI